MALNRMMTDPDPLIAFLAGKGVPGVPADVYAAEKAATAVLCPPLEYSWTRDQLDPDPRERAVERVLEIAGDYGFPIDDVVTVLSGFRPDLTRVEVRDGVYRLLDQGAEVRRASLRGLRELEEGEAERFSTLLTDLAHQPVTR